MAKVVQFIMLLSIWGSFSNGEDTYADCLKNYSVLEKAALEDDRYEIIKAFYPPDISLPSVFVKITYVSAEDADIQESWLWTSVPIYLIQPPSVFQFMALLFSHHHIANRIRDLTIHLPSGCYNTSAPSCHDSDTNTTYLNNRYLDVLTNEIHLFARYDGRNERIILDEVMPSTSMRLDNNCASIDKKSFYFFNAFSCMILPGLLLFLLPFVFHSIHPKLRNVLSSSLPKSSVNQNLAALVLTGLVLSSYIVICDIFAIYFSVGKHELSKLLDYEDEGIQIYTTIAIIIIFIWDSIATIFSILIIILSFCLQTERCDQKYLHTVLCTFCSIFTWAGKRGHYMYNPVNTEHINAIQQHQQHLIQLLNQHRVNHLQRQERWLIQKREEKRRLQAKVENSWLQQWKNELELQEDLVVHWDNFLTLQRHRLPKDHDENKLEQKIQEWKDKLNEWSNSLSAPEPSPIPDEQWQEELSTRQNSIEERQSKLQREKRDLKQKLRKLFNDHKDHKRLNKSTFSENKAWLLMFSLLAPLVCIGTHSGFVVMAWASDSGEASSIAFVFTVSFIYYFFGFKHLYIRISSLSRFKLKDEITQADELSLRDVSVELREYHKNLREINLPALFCELALVPIFMGIQVLIFFCFYYLPGPISSVPLNVMNLLQVVLFFGTGLITYKLFSFSAPREEIILDKFMKAYKSKNKSSEATNCEDIGEVLADALKKIMKHSNKSAYYNTWSSNITEEMEMTSQV